MTHASNLAPRLTAACPGPRAGILAALTGALLLAACSTGHIGDSWQCPLAEGGLCDSVAAADPAVPDPDATGKAVHAEPLWRVRGNGSVETLPAREPAPDAIRGPGQACAAECDDGFDPFAWLMGLFDAGGDDDEGRAGPAAREPEPAMTDIAPETTAPPPAPAGTELRVAEPAPVLLPAEPGSAQDVPDAGDLRTGEIVARIWIAPFVDADGVYREASHVRVVLEPAGWRVE